MVARRSGRALAARSTAAPPSTRSSRRCASGSTSRSPLDEMARIAYLSPFYFNRIFRQLTGVPPRRFHTALRIDAAKRLLLTTDLSVTEMCLEVGYQSLGTFTTHFHELVGVSPRALRRLASEPWPAPRWRPRAPVAEASVAPAVSGDLWAPTKTISCSSGCSIRLPTGKAGGVHGRLWIGPYAIRTSVGAASTSRRRRRVVGRRPRQPGARRRQRESRAGQHAGATRLRSPAYAGRATAPQAQHRPADPPRPAPRHTGTSTGTVTRATSTACSGSSRPHGERYDRSTMPSPKCRDPSSHSSTVSRASSPDVAGPANERAATQALDVRLIMPPRCTSRPGHGGWSRSRSRAGPRRARAGHDAGGPDQRFSRRDVPTNIAQLAFPRRELDLFYSGVVFTPVVIAIHVRYFAVPRMRNATTP